MDLDGQTENLEIVRKHSSRWSVKDQPYQKQGRQMDLDRRGKRLEMRRLMVRQMKMVQYHFSRRYYNSATR
jgi:hypothetical protein